LVAIRQMLMKQAEGTRGTSLAGLAVKVTPTIFLVGLSSDVERTRKAGPGFRVAQIRATLANGIPTQFR
jgi:hypothetical protein